MMKNLKLKGKIVEVFGTAGDFANAVGAREDIVSRVIHGRRQLNPEDRERWALALGDSPQRLFEVGETGGGAA